MLRNRDHLGWQEVLQSVDGDANDGLDPAGDVVAHSPHHLVDLRARGHGASSQETPSGDPLPQCLAGWCTSAPSTASSPCSQGRLLLRLFLPHLPHPSVSLSLLSFSHFFPLSALLLSLPSGLPLASLVSSPLRASPSCSPRRSAWRLPRRRSSPAAASGRPQSHGWGAGRRCSSRAAGRRRRAQWRRRASRRR